MSLSLSNAIAQMVTVSDEEMVRLSADACHCCPNCDGPITVGEDEAAGICSNCYFAECTSTSQYSH